MYKFIKKNIFKSCKGSALTMAIMAVVGVTTLALYQIRSARIAKNISIKQQADTDVENATALLSAFLLNPYNCTATFKASVFNETTSATDYRSINSIYGCGGAPNTCIDTTTGRDTNPSFGVRTGTTEASWTGTPLSTYNAGGTGLTSMVRIKSMRYYLKSAQINNTPPVNSTPAFIYLDIVFEKNIGRDNDSASPTYGLRKTTTAIRTITFPVVFSGGIIVGCPRSPVTTTLVP